MGASRARFPAWLVAAMVALAALVLWSFAVGRFPVTPAQVARALWAALTGSASGLAPNVDAIVTQVRAPRIVAALAVGAALAAAGAAFQSLFKNPLVSPDILGVTAGCSLGAGIAVLLSLPIAGIQALAFAGGLAAVGLVVLVAAGVGGRDPILTLILTGVVVGSLFGAGVALVKFVADPYNQLPAITFWLLGSLAGVTPGDLRGAVPAVLLGLAPLVLLRWRVDVLSLGDEEAKALGVEAGRLRRVVVAAATLVTAAVVAISGQIGWVGLIMPHVARMLVGPGFARLLPTAMLLGAGYLLLVDTLARSLSTVETPLGILTALVGAPFFLWLLARGRTGWA